MTVATKKKPLRNRCKVDNEKYENQGKLRPILPKIVPDGGKTNEDILARQPDVKPTWIIQVSFGVSQ